MMILRVREWTCSPFSVFYHLQCTEIQTCPQLLVKKNWSCCEHLHVKKHKTLILQSKRVKRSSHEWINNFIVANLISGIISIIWFLDEWCKIQIKPEFKTRILIGLLLTSGARLAWEFDRFTICIICQGRQQPAFPFKFISLSNLWNSKK